MNITVTNRQEKWRADTLLTKEPGTIAWIKAEVKLDDVFYDIGSNIGLYALYAAERIGPEGFVYAFEPHVVTAKSLFQNLANNACGKQIQVITSALHDTIGFFPFNYATLTAGSSSHQLGAPIDEFGRGFTPVAVELKHSITVDCLIESKIIRPATLIKLDVDGNESAVLRGTDLLLTNGPLRSIQVEVHPKDKLYVLQFMTDHGFNLTGKHYTADGQKAIEAGWHPEKVAHNLVFHRV